MKNVFLAIIAVVSVGSQAYAHPENPNAVAIAKATELGVHRIERLVTLKKIDPMFQSHLYAMKAERTTESGAAYKVYGYVQPDANNQASTITMLSDAQGKVLSYTVSQTFQPANPVSWPDKDALTLTENGLHFVLEGWVQHPEVKAFFLGLSSITMRAVNAGGTLLAEFAVTSDDDAHTLIVRVKADGTFHSYEMR